ncbi:MAG: MarR family transcriptional regulator [Candidatus Dormibacteraeota bacterium]|nr:MarR family transcriptional regulator [Candidatus Dormibacteraeota bacterium]
MIKIVSTASTTLERAPAEVVAPGQATEMADAVSRLRRAIRQRMRQEFGIPTLPEAQLELMRLVGLEPGLRVQEAAHALGVAPNTVSTLVRQLASAGILERKHDRSDGRVCRLFLTRGARARWELRRDRRERVLGAALGLLSDEDRAAIAGAVPALNRLVRTLSAGGQTRG